ncbi:hypothetical protein Q033_02129 [Pseudomonas aeruginosa BWHPSA020]|nr:hypothetical protein Q088_00849 [Pseudomonas aeruginosa C41]ERU90157.1 hypothetical protein Q084_03287 [Pseudomonas aeruginosa M9A.1]ERW38451.1 hypothetical protein Q033_02129 [Pseudomonas aeruginosa BWHPSA020]ERX56355.1 hypothetical protein Q005_03463 [Pseudomonas aeruginosa X24509]KYO83800.1 hypothetical protein LT18_00333 [Pseudomonas aeruginosa]MBK5018340.1 hypothetical protein [Pseudomonas sp. S68]
MAIRSEDSDGFWQAFSRQEQDSTNRLLPTTLAAPFILCASSATPCRSASSSNSANRVRSSRLLANKVSSNRCNAAGSPPVMASSERMSKRLSIGDSEPSSFIQTPSICLKEGHCALRYPACGTPGIRRTTRPYMPSGPVIRKQHKGIASASAVQTGEHRLLRLLERTQTALETLMAGTESTFASRPQPARPLVSGRETPTVSLCEEASSVATA